jgi:acetyl esterase/lipase
VPGFNDELEQRTLMSGNIAASSATVAHWYSQRREGRLPLDPATWTVEHNIPFPTVDGQFELLDVYEPGTPTPPGGRPVVVAIHGGGWRRLDKLGYGERIARAFVPEGYVVVAPNYQLSSPGSPTWPTNLEDVQAAVRWIRGNADTLGIDPGKIAAIGESAGANLAALLGTGSPDSSMGGAAASVQVVVAFSTPSDLAALQSESPLAALATAQFLGGSPQQLAANYAAASPVDQAAAGDPPMFLVHGRQDPLIPVGQSRELSNALAEHAVRHQLVIVNGGHNLDFPDHYAKLISQILEFFNTTWKDLGVPISSSNYQP